MATLFTVWVWPPNFHCTVCVKLEDAREILTVMPVLPAVTFEVESVKLLALGMVGSVTLPVTDIFVSLDVMPNESKNPLRLMVLEPSELCVTVLLTVLPILTQLVPILK